jgi:hypothetical protein
LSLSGVSQLAVMNEEGGEGFVHLIVQSIIGFQDSRGSEAKQRYSGSGTRSGMGWDGHVMCCWMIEWAGCTYTTSHQ